MKQILPPISMADALCGKQQVRQVPYRWTSLCQQVLCDDGILLYHTLRGELLLLTENEIKIALTDPEISGKLKEKWFLVPTDFDDCKFSDQCLETVSLMTPPPEGISSFTIFSTTDCNARCFYCYEMGRPRRMMTEKTAHDVAAYMLKVSNGQKLTLHWFGGEPLFNAAAINTIVEDIRAAGREFTSSMISNSYLFDEAMVRTAAGKWQLKQMQVTLDGTEDIYNSTKAFIYRDGGSAYFRVLKAIGLLLKAKIRVSVRMNVDRHNVEDLMTLIDILAERFGGDKNFSAYTHLLFDNNRRHDFADQQTELASITKLNAKLDSAGITGVRKLPRDIKPNVCMGDSDSSRTILPDGWLGKCEHFSEDHFVGSIYSDNTDQTMLNAFKERRKPVADCRICAWYPQCHVLTLCNTCKPCTELERTMHLNDLQRMILASYRKSKKDGGESDADPAKKPESEIENC